MKEFLENLFTKLNYPYEVVSVRDPAIIERLIDSASFYMVDEDWYKVFIDTNNSVVSLYFVFTHDERGNRDGVLLVTENMYGEGSLLHLTKEGVEKWLKDFVEKLDDLYEKYFNDEDFTKTFEPTEEEKAHEEEQAVLTPEEPEEGTDSEEDSDDYDDDDDDDESDEDDDDESDEDDDESDDDSDDEEDDDEEDDEDDDESLPEEDEDDEEESPEPPKAEEPRAKVTTPKAGAPAPFSVDVPPTVVPFSVDAQPPKASAPFGNAGPSTSKTPVVPSPDPRVAFIHGLKKAIVDIGFPGYNKYNWASTDTDGIIEFSPIPPATICETPRIGLTLFFNNGKWSANLAVGGDQYKSTGPTLANVREDYCSLL